MAKKRATKAETQLSKQYKLTGSRRDKLATFLKRFHLDVVSEDQFTTYVYDKLSGVKLPETQADIEGWAMESSPTPEEIAKNALTLLQQKGVNRNADIDKAAEKVRICWRDEANKAPFKLGDALNALIHVYAKSRGREPSKGTLRDILNIDITPQRISSLALTAAFFPKGVRDDAITFKAFEKARKIAQKQAKAEGRDARPAAELVEQIRSGELFTADEAENQSHSLVIRVNVDASTKPPTFTAAATADGRAVEIGKAFEPWMPDAVRTAYNLLENVGRGMNAGIQLPDK